MRELTSSAARKLLERVDNGIGLMVREVEVVDATTLCVRVSVQDSLRGYDWIDILFHITGVSDARVVDSSRYGLLDTSDGITICFEDKFCAIALGRYNNITVLKSAQLYVVGNSIRYEELEFKGE